jgi:hypothetical protein
MIPVAVVFSKTNFNSLNDEEVLSAGFSLKIKVLPAQRSHMPFPTISILPSGPKYDRLPPESFITQDTPTVVPLLNELLVTPPTTWKLKVPSVLKPIANRELFNEDGLGSLFCVPYPDPTPQVAAVVTTESVEMPMTVRSKL